MRPHMRGREGH
ncbi:unnamed protein product [Larinioides sclopetarius]|uniref:Uncharacterized protein n=1 Tax=Larinioides sclopetarius TaxID=280406 RepID=A0AAV2A8Q9_9ARAC